MSSVPLDRITPSQVRRLSDEDYRLLLTRLFQRQKQDQQQNQLLYYRPVSPHAEQVHRSTAKYLGVGGGNGSSKTETCLAHIAAMATGIIPRAVPYLQHQFRGPINVRIVVESLTTVLHPIILPKLKWWVWTGIGSPDSDQGHWGWIPRLNLIDGEWSKSWSEKLRLLRLICRDPDDPSKMLGESQIQFMSVDQDPSDFASGDFHIVLHDEPPNLAIWNENEARTMRVGGRMMLSMTWKEDPAIPVDWIYDEMYDKGRPGPNKSPHHDWFELYTIDNPHLNQDAVSVQMENWSHEMIQVRIYGQPIRFSNRVHPLYTDVEQWWCFTCQRPIVPLDGKCSVCQNEFPEKYLHYKDFEHSRAWPCIWILDPHPRKPHMFMWVQVDPADDYWVVAEGEVEGDPTDVRFHVEQIEENLGINTQRRLIDPNMGRSPSSARRDQVWQDEFDAAGLMCDLADDSDVGRGRVNEYLRPDPQTMQPRLHVHSRCQTTNFQLKRYIWDEHKQRLEKDLKQKPRTKYDDYPTMLKYLMNDQPMFRWLKDGPPVIKRPGARRGAYG